MRDFHMFFEITRKTKIPNPLSMLVYRNDILLSTEFAEKNFDKYNFIMPKRIYAPLLSYYENPQILLFEKHIFLSPLLRRFHKRRLFNSGIHSIIYIYIFKKTQPNEEQGMIAPVISFKFTPAWWCFCQLNVLTL